MTMSLENHISVFKEFMNPAIFLELQKYVSGLPINAATPVFNISTGENIVDPNVRNSRYITMNDESVLKMLRKYFIERFKEVNPDLVVELARSYYTFIRYDEGGFFDWHEDNERFRINSGQRWLECHAILCLEPPSDGGELEIADRKIQLERNTCVVFDKRLIHRGAPVNKGIKVIMTLDVLVSTICAQSYQCLGTEAADCLQKVVTFMTPYNDEAIVKDFPPGSIVFEYLEISKTDNDQDKDEKPKWYRRVKPTIHRFIIDCNGIYLHNNQVHGRKTGPRARRTSKKVDMDDLLSEVLSAEDVNVIGTLSRVKFPQGSRPIPRKTDQSNTFSSIVIADGVMTPRKLSATYHCNETNYDQFDIYQYVGVLFPDDADGADDADHVDHADGEDGEDDADHADGEDGEYCEYCEYCEDDEDYQDPAEPLPKSFSTVGKKIYTFDPLSKEMIVHVWFEEDIGLPVEYSSPDIKTCIYMIDKLCLQKGYSFLDDYTDNCGRRNDEEVEYLFKDMETSISTPDGKSIRFGWNP